jgi:hypothetical protein
MLGVKHPPHTLQLCSQILASGLLVLVFVPQKMQCECTERLRFLKSCVPPGTRSTPSLGKGPEELQCKVLGLSMSRSFIDITFSEKDEVEPSFFQY